MRTLLCLLFASSLYAQTPLRPYAFWVKPASEPRIAQIDTMSGQYISKVSGAVFQLQTLMPDTSFSIVGAVGDTLWSRSYLTAPQRMTLKVIAKGTNPNVTLTYWAGHKTAETDAGSKAASNLPPPFFRFDAVTSYTVDEEGAHWWHVDEGLLPPTEWYFVTLKRNLGDAGDTVVNITSLFYAQR